MYKIMAIALCCTVVLASCRKRSCWECSVTAAGLQYTDNICDKTKKQVKEMQANPHETKDKDGEVIYTTTYSNCVQK